MRIVWVKPGLQIEGGGYKRTRTARRILPTCPKIIPAVDYKRKEEAVVMEARVISSEKGRSQQGALWSWERSSV